MQGVMGRVDWRRLGLAIYVAVNVGLILFSAHPGPHNIDWRLWEALDPANPYIVVDNVGYVWSPLAAWIMTGVVQIGYWPWFAAHFLAVLLIRDRLTVFLALASWALWTDAALGNTFTFVFVAGALALKGNRYGEWAYLALCLLIPRPLQIPLALYLLWNRPHLRVGFAALVVAHGMAVLSTGLLGEWITAARSFDVTGYNIGPGKWLGYWWMLVAIPLSGWLLWRGRLGWASYVISPYITPQYFLVLLWEPTSAPATRAESRTVPARPSRTGYRWPRPAIR